MTEAECICPRFSDLPDGTIIADLTCPVHGVGGSDPGDVLPAPHHMSTPADLIRNALLKLRDGSLTWSMASNAPPALEALDALLGDLAAARLDAERLRAENEWFRTKVLDAGDYNEGETCWCPDWWWDKNTGGAELGEHSSLCESLRAALADSAAAQEGGGE